STWPLCTRSPSTTATSVAAIPSVLALRIATSHGNISPWAGIDTAQLSDRASVVVTWTPAACCLVARAFIGAATNNNPAITSFTFMAYSVHVINKCVYYAHIIDGSRGCQ